MHSDFWLVELVWSKRLYNCVWKNDSIDLLRYFPKWSRWRKIKAAVLALETTAFLINSYESHRLFQPTLKNRTFISPNKRKPNVDKHQLMNSVSYELAPLPVYEFSLSRLF